MAKLDSSLYVASYGRVSEKSMILCYWEADQELCRKPVAAWWGNLCIITHCLFLCPQQDMVQRFLIMVAAHPDVSLGFLSFRLDFNQHYKVKEPNMRSPLMSLQQRMHHVWGSTSLLATKLQSVLICLYHRQCCAIWDVFISSDGFASVPSVQFGMLLLNKAFSCWVLTIALM